MHCCLSQYLLLEYSLLSLACISFYHILGLLSFFSPLYIVMIDLSSTFIKSLDNFILIGIFINCSILSFKMPYELKDIKEIRKKAGLTQGQLSKKAGVSQSLIAKIEAGRLDPTYNKAQKIFQALDNLTKTSELKAEDVMTKKVVSVARRSPIKDIIKKMRKYSISQMPVMEEDRVIGYLSESSVLEALMQDKKNIQAKDIMQDNLSTVDKNASVELLSSLLRFYPMVLVIEKGKLLGIVTKSDIIKNVYNR
ncbi:CBS domain-containing protein [Candidatus Woesearchaeota archaeon]|nr:CBS domain-containing protein [Candidatus Woesearchaeota archaeon]